MIVENNLFFIRLKGGSLSLPTFLVGIGRPNVQDGLPMQSSEVGRSETDVSLPSITSGISDYHNYLVDARNAVRQRHEATKCWLYSYDGSSPPMHSTIAHPSPLATTLKPLEEMTEEEDKDFWRMMSSSDSNDVGGEAVIMTDDSSRDSSLAPSTDPCEEALILTKDEVLNKSEDVNVSIKSLGEVFFVCAPPFILKKVLIKPMSRQDTYINLSKKAFCN